jgi:hypothetical protein
MELVGAWKRIENYSQFQKRTSEESFKENNRKENSKKKNGSKEGCTEEEAVGFLGL